jgi:Flp pilus assembly protein protease CpaA
MIEIYILFFIALVWIVFASIQDLKTREIANWLNFSLVIFALGFRFFYSLFSEGDFSFFYQGLIGFGIFFILGNLFYYGKLFAGGDAKLMMAMGAVLPITSDIFVNLEFMLLFLFLFLTVGAIYGFSFSTYFAIINRKFFKKEFKKQFKEKKKLVLLSIFFAVLFLIFGFFSPELIYLGILFFLLPYLYLYAKSVDESSMVKEVKVEILTIGDWLYKDVKVGRKVVKSKWDGLTEEEIKLLKKNKKKVWIRYGIQFAPVFFISFILYIVFYFVGFQLFKGFF